MYKLNKKYSIYTVKNKVKFSSEQIILFGLLDKLYEEYSNGILHTKFDITQLKYRNKKKKIAKLLSKRS